MQQIIGFWSKKWNFSFAYYSECIWPIELTLVSKDAQDPQLLEYIKFFNIDPIEKKLLTFACARAPKIPKKWQFSTFGAMSRPNYCEFQHENRTAHVSSRYLRGVVGNFVQKQNRKKFCAKKSIFSSFCKNDPKNAKNEENHRIISCLELHFTLGRRKNFLIWTIFRVEKKLQKFRFSVRFCKITQKLFHLAGSTPATIVPTIFLNNIPLTELKNVE